MAAGQELSVAATKTFVASVAVLLGLAATWASERALQDGPLDRLPYRLAEATQLDWSNAIGALSAAKSLAILGRGPTLAVAQEASLKLKEVCNIQAEAFSGAEFQHGPIALVSESYPVLSSCRPMKPPRPWQEWQPTFPARAARYSATGIRAGAAGVLPVLPPDHPETDAVCLIQSFYSLAIRLAERLGVNVDQPRHLQKITRTKMKTTARYAVAATIFMTGGSNTRTQPS